MKFEDAQVRALLDVLAETREQEIDCDEFLGALPAYAEARVANEPLGQSFAAVKAHERLCANCREECAALLELLTLSRTE